MSKSYTVLFGLTADPIHLGHEQAIINGIDYLRQKNLHLKEFLLIPVCQPNLIADKKAPVASYAHRVAMCKIVAGRLSKQLECDIKVSQIERKLTESTGDKNYSLNTIKAIANENHRLIGEIPTFAGKMDCLFMVSADHFQGRWPKFRKWFGWQELLKYSGLLINYRPGHKINLGFIQRLKEINPEIYIVENPTVIEVSSSQIRSGELNKKNLSQDVFQFVCSKELY